MKRNDCHLIRANIIAAIVMTICFTFLTMWKDMYVIGGWGAEFGRCVLNGSISELAPKCMQSTGFICNYSMVFTIFDGIWEFPVVLIEKAVGASIDLFVYAMWLKILVLCFFALTIREVFLICTHVNKFGKNKRYVVLCVFLSAFIQIPILSMGQVDGISLFFCIAAVRMYVEHRRKAVPFLISIAYLIKPWCVIFFFPIILLYIYEERKNLVYMIIGFLVPILLNSGLERMILGEYYSTKTEANKEFLQRFSKVSIRGCSVFFVVMFVVFLLCIYLLANNIYGIDIAMAFSTIVFATVFVFFEWHPQYLVYGTPIMIYLVFSITEKADSVYSEAFSLLLYVLINVAFVEIMMCSFSVEPMQYGLIGYIVKKEYNGHPIIAYVQKYYLYVNEASISLLVAALLVLLCIFIYKCVFSSKRNISENASNDGLCVNSIISTLLFTGNVLVIMGYFFISMYLYVRDAMCKI